MRTFITGYFSASTLSEGEIAAGSEEFDVPIRVPFFTVKVDPCADQSSTSPSRLNSYLHGTREFIIS